MLIRLTLSSAALVTAVASVGTGQKAPSQAAKAFTLDSIAVTPTPDAKPEPAASVAAPSLAAQALPQTATVATTVVATSPAPTIRAVFTLDTPIQDLIADPGAKGVLDRDLPGMSDDENLGKFKMLSLRSLQPQTGGQLTDAMLAKVATDLDLLAGGTGSTAMALPVKAGNSKRNADISR